MLLQDSVVVPATDPRLTFCVVYELTPCKGKASLHESSGLFFNGTDGPADLRVFFKITVGPSSTAAKTADFD
jgi:hypothetical protein